MFLIFLKFFNTEFKCELCAKVLKGRNSVVQHLGSYHRVIDNYLLDDSKDATVLPIEIVEAFLNDTIKEEAEDDDGGAIADMEEAEAEDDDGGAIADISLD